MRYLVLQWGQVASSMPTSTGNLLRQFRHLTSLIISVLLSHPPPTAIVITKVSPLFNLTSGSLTFFPFIETRNSDEITPFFGSTICLKSFPYFLANLSRMCLNLEFEFTSSITSFFPTISLKFASNTTLTRMFIDFFTTQRLDRISGGLQI